MPNVTDYLKGFDLRKRMVVAGYRLEKISVKHITLTQYRLYQYPTTMVWVPEDGEGTASIQQLADELWELTKRHRIIRSRYGNPYRCSFGKIEMIEEEDGSVIARSIGGAERVFLSS